MQAILEQLARGRDLDSEQAWEALSAITSGGCTGAQVGAFLMGYRHKPLTDEELTTFAQIMREQCRQIRPRVEGDLIDVCGTGGARIKTFNVSTIAAFVVAAAGLPVAKHGNRSVTSPSGSADLVEALGVDLSLDWSETAQVIEKIGIGFLFAPAFHPAMRHVAEAREELGFRSLFNVLGPLTNPAQADVQLLGVYDRALVELFPSVLKKLGVKRCMVVHGQDGIDEISTIGTTSIGECGQNGEIRCYEIEPGSFGLKRVAREDIGGLPPAESASVAVKMLRDRHRDARYEMVILNAGAAIYLGEGMTLIEGGLERAETVIQEGKAWEKVCELVAATGGELLV